MTRAHHSSRTFPEDAMRLLSRYALLAVGLVVWGCRSDTTSVRSTLAAPQNLAYQLNPSGDPNSPAGDRKSTRLNSSHRCISYAVFCLKKKKQQQQTASAHIPIYERRT